MANKMQFYAQMAEDAARQITGSQEQWTAFLQTAARLYKYPYHEQLMIFAQRPDATACAEYDLWNDTMRRYVRRGSKGIALIDTRGDRPRLRYVFDVSDTGERKNSRPVQLWEMKEEYREPIMQALEQAFEVSREGQSLESMIYAAAERLAADSGTTIAGRSSTSLRIATWQAMMDLKPEWHSGGRRQPALPTVCTAGARMIRTATSNMRISWTSLISIHGRQPIRWGQQSAACPHRSSGRLKSLQETMSARRRRSRHWKKNTKENLKQSRLCQGR